jgi:catechol 2,3-dioxygenase-like lactoylglutathione lyase family enzyme
MIGPIDEVVIDCADPGGLAAFWSGVLGGEPIERDPDWWYILPPGWTQLSFQRVPEGKVVKNRVHLDVRTGDLAAATAQALALGATCFGEPHHGEFGSFQVLQDPEGNEWCVVSPRGAVPAP